MSSTFPSAGTGLLNFSYPWRPRERTMYTGNYILAKVEGRNMMLTTRELQQLLKNGYDVEVMGYQRGDFP